MADKFEEACAEADMELRLGGWRMAAIGMYNKAIALLKLGRFSEAEALCQSNREMNNYKSAGDWILLGVSQWLQGKRHASVEAWRAAMKSPYTDAAGGVEERLLLLYAAKALILPDLERFALENLKRLSRRGAWPGPLAAFAVGIFGEDEVRARIESIHALHAKQSCQAEFYFGVLCKEPSRRIEYFWRSAFDFVPDSYITAEHHLAIHEYNHLKDRGRSGQI